MSARRGNKERGLSPLGSRRESPEDRRAALLEVALNLIAERGYHGASLRELAKRLGVSQPSLYHYFSSKEELVEQIIDHYAELMYADLPPPGLSLEQLAQVSQQYVLALYEGERQPTFVRFMFAVSRVDLRFGQQLREVFTIRPQQQLAAYLVRVSGELGLEPERVGNVFRAQISAIALRLMEERVLFDPQPISPETYRYAEEVTRMTISHLRAMQAEGE